MTHENRSCYVCDIKGYLCVECLNNLPPSQLVNIILKQRSLIRVLEKQYKNQESLITNMHKIFNTYRKSINKYNKKYNKKKQKCDESQAYIQ
jgi:hypothetical protein